MSRPTDGFNEADKMLAHAFLKWLDSTDNSSRHRVLNLFEAGMLQADMSTNSQKVTTPPERVQIPAESEHDAPYDRCPTCTAHMPVGQTCGGVNCGLRRTE